jgi:hypothetical protein
MEFKLNQERNYEFRKRLDCPHQANRRNFALKPGKNEIAASDGWSIYICQNPSAALLNAAKDLQDYFFTSMNVSLLLKKADNLSELAETGRNCIILADKSQLKTLGATLSVSRSYRFIVENAKIIVCGNDCRGAAQGAFYIEDLMNLKEAPYLKKTDIKREPAFHPRMIHSGWGLDIFPDRYLNLIAHSGMDSILVFAKGVDTAAAGYLDFNDLVRRADAYGLDVYFYSYLKSRKHPEEKDAEAYYDSTYGELFKACPGAKGIILVGESCEFPSKDPNTSGRLYGEPSPDGIPDSKPGPGWWPCYDYPAWLSMLKKVVRKYSASAEIVFWTYNWGWAPEADRLKLINSLPEDITLLVTFEMFEQIKRNCAVHNCVDYTIALPGPGQYFTSEAKAAAKRGIKLYAMCNTGGLTWDFGVIPYQPVPQQWNKRCQGLLDAKAKWNLSGLMESHHYGWTPSFVSEMVKAGYWTPTAGAAETLRQIAKRDFEDGYKDALKAWNLWSRAMNYYVTTNEDQYGPCRVGPSYPFIFHPDINKTFVSQEILLPAAGHAHFGNAIVKTMYHPYEDARQSPGPMRLDVEIKCLEKMRKLWQEGNVSLEQAVTALTGSKRENGERLLLLGMFIHNCLTTIINIKRWYKLNRMLTQEKRPAAAEKLLDKIIALGNEEIKNAEATIPIVEKDSRLGWEPTMDYMTDDAHLRWKVKQLDSVINVEIPKYRKALSL